MHVVVHSRGTVEVVVDFVRVILIRLVALRYLRVV
jgi:hypothetical protein